MVDVRVGPYGPVSERPADIASASVPDALRSRWTTVAAELAKLPTYTAVKATIREYAETQVRPINRNVEEILSLHAPAIAVWISDRMQLAPVANATATNQDGTPGETPPSSQEHGA